MARILGASAQMRVKHLLRELNHVRKMDAASVKNSILKAGAEKKKETYPVSRFITSPKGRALLAAALTGSAGFHTATAHGFRGGERAALTAAMAGASAGAMGLGTYINRVIHARALKGRKALHEEASFEKKLSADKTAPADPEMLSQVGTIIKRIRAKTDPSGSAELGLAAKEAAVINRVAAGVGSKMVNPVAAAVPKVKAPTASPVAKPRDIHAGGKRMARYEGGESIGAWSTAFGSDPNVGVHKFTCEQAMALLKAALVRISA